MKRSVAARARVALLSGAAVIAIGAGIAHADSVETVVVTGTRIPQPDYQMPNPVTSIGGEELQHNGTTNLTDYLQRIPALVGSLNNYSVTGYNTPSSDAGASLAGLNLLNLRNLGFNRTLVLIDGKRQVSESQGNAAVDTDTIPITLIDRVDVETGGSSAIYGADAVSGVVNFIMKHDLEGLHARVQGGVSQDGGGDNALLAVSAGWNFDDDKGNVTITDEYAYSDRLNYKQRKFSRVGGWYAFVPNPADPSDDPNLPDFIPVNNATYIWSAPSGAIDVNTFKHGKKPGFGPDFTGDGQPYIHGIEYDAFDAIGGSGMPYATDLHGDFLPQETRNVAQVGARYDFSDKLKVTGEFKWAHVYTDAYSTPPFDDFTAIFADNAFLPANVAARIAANVKSIGKLPNRPTEAWGVLGEDYLQLTREEKTIRDTYRAVLDASGDLTSSDDSFIKNLHYDVSYVWGQTKVDDQDVNNRVEDRFFAAMDSVIDPGTGKPTCRSNLDPSKLPPDIGSRFATGYPAFSDTSLFDPAEYPLTFTPGPGSGCVPFNPFDPNYNNAASLAWITKNTHTRATITQNVVTGALTGQLPLFESIFAGPLGIAVGGEYRKEQSDSFGDPLAQHPGATFDPGPQDVLGSFDVKEVFGEISQLVVSDKPFAKEITVTGAVRHSSYSTAGDTTTWKYGGVWAPFDQIRFRGTYAYAVRAPNIGELFAPTQTLFQGVSDPCDYHFVHSGTSFRPANCIAIFNALGLPYDPNDTTPGGTADLNTGATILTPVSGNPLLKTEAARTLTFGTVITPTGFIENLSISVDWYRVKIANAIAAPDAGDIADECVDLSTIANEFCILTHRNAGNAGRLSSIEAKEINLAEYDTQGQDFTATYHFDTADFMDDGGFGAFNFHLVGGHLDTLGNVPTPGEARVDNTGYIGPKWQGSLDVVWSIDKWTLDYNIDWWAKTYRYDLQTLASQPDTVDPKYIKYPARFMNNIQVGYQASDMWQVYAGINNLFYQKPAIGATGYPVDPIGRTFYVGANIDVDWDKF
ncbi:MAG TPA: TonB-dependent receptor [Rhizomicrobium sp.]|jgi:outer membrane receptor protein involved in Fe transport|nr:TonB-dependent receptor [Rhizomicrobium sp.]